MGILNATPDSFYAESRCCSSDQDFTLAITCAKYLEANGADLIDIGGESTRPGALPVTLSEELQRVIPLIQAIKPHVNIPISIDTMKAEVAKAAVDAGASLINDVSGLNCPKMREVAASLNVPVCAVHAEPHQSPASLRSFYNGQVTDVILKWFDQTMNELTKSGIAEKNIILDPGIGFGKTVADNLEILHNLRKLKAFGAPLLLGISRKSFMGKILNLPPSELLPVTLTINSLAIEAGVDYIRVHDVKEHKEAVLVLSELLDSH